MRVKPAAAAILLMVAAPAQAAFNPVEFFRGKTHGAGMLKIIFQSPKKMMVDSLGRAESDGSLVLEQVVHAHGQGPWTRH